MVCVHLKANKPNKHFHIYSVYKKSEKNLREKHIGALFLSVLSFLSDLISSNNTSKNDYSLRSLSAAHSFQKFTSK